MNKANIIIDTHVRLQEDEFDPIIIQFIKQALTFPNQEKITAKKEHLWGWEDLDDEIFFWQRKRGQLILPRGFAAPLASGLRQKNFEIIFDDNRVTSNIPEFMSGSMKPVELRDYQEKACAALVHGEQGIYQAPPGAGKTVTMLEAIRQTNQKSIVITNTTHFAEQWRQRCNQFLGVNAGLIGDNVWDESPITIALQQTLWSMRDELDDWWGKWGLVCLDECHHAPAETFQDILQRFPAKYRIGLSATPGKGYNKLAPIAECVIGNIIHKTEKEFLKTKGILIKPKIKVVKTIFDYPYHSTFRVGKWDDCPVEGCTKTYAHTHRNNYTKMMGELAEDVLRNNLITFHINQNKEHCNLIISKRLKQLHIIHDNLVELGWALDEAVMLTGKESVDRRMEIYAQADKANIAIFSTVADEALDIPRIDRLYRIWPTRNTDIVRQEIGRAERIHPDKTDAIIYDFFDERVGVLKNQFFQRRRDIYIPEKLDEIIYPGDSMANNPATTTATLPT